MPRKPVTRATAKKGWQGKACAAMSLGATVSDAAKVAGVDRRTIYRHLDSDPEFRKAFEDAEEQGTDVLEAEAIRRATHGVDEPVIYQGKPTLVGFDKNDNPCEPDAVVCVRREMFTIRKPSDTLMIFMLKGRRPQKFRDNATVEHTGKNGGAIETVAKVPIDMEKFVSELARELERSAQAAVDARQNGNGQLAHSDHADSAPSDLPNR